MIPTTLDVEVTSSKQGQGKGHHGVRHQHRSSDGRHGAKLASDSHDSASVPPADQPVNDVETFDDVDHGTRRQDDEDKEKVKDISIILIFAC